MKKVRLLSFIFIVYCAVVLDLNFIKSEGSLFMHVDHLHHHAATGVALLLLSSLLVLLP